MTPAQEFFRKLKGYQTKRRQQTVGQTPYFVEVPEIYQILSEVPLKDALGCAFQPVFDIWKLGHRYEEVVSPYLMPLVLNVFDYMTEEPLARSDVLSGIDTLMDDFNNLSEDDFELHGDEILAVIEFAYAVLNQDLQQAASAVNRAITALYPGDDEESAHYRQEYLAKWGAECIAFTPNTVGQPPEEPREYRVELTRPARKMLKKIAAKDQKRIRSTINHLVVDPFPPGSYKTMKPQQGRAVKVGSQYRVLYEVDKERRTVSVYYAGLRGGIPGWRE